MTNNHPKKNKKIFGKWAPEAILYDPKQFWMVVFMFAMGLIMFCEIQYHISPDPYLTFMTFVGSFFMGGQHLVEWLKNNKSQTTNTSTQEDTTSVVATTNQTTVVASQPVIAPVLVTPGTRPRDWHVDYKELYKGK